MSTLIDKILSQADAYLHELPAPPAPLAVPAGADLAGWIDHTILKPEATEAQIRKLCAEAREHHFATVCVNPAYGFPLGATFPETKAAETRQARQAGATEIDTVINFGALKSGNFELALRDVQAVVEAAAGQAHVKVILEMCYLDQREKIIGILLCQAAKADFVKTSTGFGPSGATVADVALMRRLVGTEMGVKAAGGIRTLADARQMIAAGANRLGASAGISILKEAGVA
jgi:deoxyribose-phosphate aldolase